MNHPVKAAIDAGAIGALLGVLIDVLPQVTVVLTFVWAVGRLFEMFTGTPVYATKPVQKMLRLLKGSKCSG